MNNPKLAMMRAKRQAEVDELAAPYMAAARRSAAMAHEEREARLGLERVMRSKMLPAITDQVAHSLGEYAFKGIREAVMKASKFAPTTMIEVPTDMLMSGDPHSVICRVVDWWKAETAPKMSWRAFRGEMEISRGVTVLDVRMPEMSYRQHVVDHV